MNFDNNNNNNGLSMWPKHKAAFSEREYLSVFKELTILYRLDVATLQAFLNDSEAAANKT